jgi:CubicO group peptidase (beta-lactamase class C family)
MLSGHVRSEFSSMVRSLMRLLPQEGQGGAALCVYHRGECVVDIWAGTRDLEGRPWEEDTVALSWSTTKGILSTLLHILIDRKLADYDVPVSHFWPEFAQADKEKITIRQVLCHEAGLYRIGDMIDDAREMFDWNRMVNALERARPAHPPGEAHAYHGLTYGWLVGELIRRIAGAELPDLLRQELADPLGLDGLYFGLPAHARTRCADVIGVGGSESSPGCDMERQRKAILAPFARRARVGAARGGEQQCVDEAELHATFLPRGYERLDWNSEAVRAGQIPALSGFFTARSLAKVYALLAGGGEVDGVRLLSRRTIARATQIQNNRPGRVIPMPMEWRLGYHRIPLVRAQAPRAFGHFGIGGSGAWADPERELAMALVLNSGVGTPFGDTRIVRVSSHALQAADALALSEVH